MKRIAIRICLYLSLFYIVGGVVLCEMTLHIPRKPVDGEAGQEAQAAARMADSDLETVAIGAADGLVLRGWFFRNRARPAKTVILLHGQADNRAGMANHAKLFLRHHYDVLVPDNRAHGDSDGNITTYGALETDDVHRWLDWLSRDGNTGCIYGIGESMGAAILLQSLVGELRFCAVVVESPFASLREIGYDRVGEFFRSGTWLGRSVLRPQIEFAFLYGRIRYGANLAGVSPVRAGAKSSIPVLLIHGMQDDTILPRHSEKLSRSRTPNIELWEPPHAGHTQALSNAPDEFESRVMDFFASHSTR